MHNNKRQLIIEGTIYTIIWIFVLFILIFLSQRNNEIQWYKVLHDTIALIPFFLIFIVNNTWLSNRFLFKKKYVWYFGITAILVVIISHPKITFLLHNLVEIPNNKHDIGPLPPHPKGGFTPLISSPRGANLEPLRPGMQPVAKGHFIRYLNNILLSVLVVGFNTAIKQAGRLIKEERIRHKLNEEKLQAELSFLKHQISPHFLMNTLNNIHALVELDPKDAQTSIVKLSHMLRYLLYEEEDKKTSLIKEIEFIKSYTKLMQMRYTNDLEVKLEFPENVPTVSIPPFVFITILENAFKHGAAINKKCFIHLSISIENNYLVVTCCNSKQSEVSLPKAESSGIGLVNTRKRLNLYYGDEYVWEVEDVKEKYTSTIKLPIHAN